jgi:beta-glucosidase
MSLSIAVLAAALATATAPVDGTAPAPAAGPAAARPASDAVEARAERLLASMTQSEKLSLVQGLFGSARPAANYLPPPEARMGSAGYLPGVPRVGVPPLWETDAGLGVATQRDSLEPYRQRTSLPSGLATAATFDPELARRGGEMIGL